MSGSRPSQRIAPAGPLVAYQRLHADAGTPRRSVSDIHGHFKRHTGRSRHMAPLGRLCRRRFEGASSSPDLASTGHVMPETALGARAPEPTAAGNTGGAAAAGMDSTFGPETGVCAGRGHYCCCRGRALTVVRGEEKAAESWRGMIL